MTLPPSLGLLESTVQIVKELEGNESGAEEDLLLKDRAIADFLQI